VPKKIEETPQVAYDRPQGCLLRLFWMVAGNLALLALILSIFNQGGFSFLDAIYWLVVGALAATRYVDIRRFAGLTVHGTPATMTDFRRYGTRLLMVATGLWIVVHALQRVI